MKKLRYGMVGGGPEGVKFVHACLRSNVDDNTWTELVYKTNRCLPHGGGGFYLFDKFKFV